MALHGEGCENRLARKLEAFQPQSTVLSCPSAQNHGLCRDQFKWKHSFLRSQPRVKRASPDAGKLLSGILLFYTNAQHIQSCVNLHERVKQCKKVYCVINVIEDVH